MKKNYGVTWMWLFIASFLIVAWITEGQGYVRRQYFTPASVPESSRVESQFLALLFPKITKSESEFTMSEDQLQSILSGLRNLGYIPIGLEDVAGFYKGDRRLPSRAVMIAFGDDNPRSVKLADKVLKRLRMRGVIFIRGIASSGELPQRQFLSMHAVQQMIKGGAWDFGAAAMSAPNPAPELVRLNALLDAGGRGPLPSDAQQYPFRFVASELGLNDKSDSLQSLHIMTIHAALPPDTSVQIVQDAWPRTEAFVDNFESGALAPHWINAWGIVSVGNRRLALLPTPKQTGAAVFLRGTDKWRDIALEFELDKYQREFWAYARYREDGRFVRVGVRDGYWYVEQKIGPNNLPSRLGRSLISQEDFPAHVRFVLKGDSAILHINGRMQFGHSVRIHANVAEGRVMLAVYDPHPRSAMALVSHVEARPIGRDWIVLANKGGSGGLIAEDHFKNLREELPYASAVSPLWLTVGSDGSVKKRFNEHEVIATIAGFYHCELMPMTEFSEKASFFDHAEKVRRTFSELTEAVLQEDVAGLNLHFHGPELEQPHVIEFLKKLRGELHSFRRELWVTLDKPIAFSLDGAVDGVLKPSHRKVPGLALLEASRSHE